MKKTIAILSLILALALSSCQGGDDVKTGGTTSDETSADTSAVTKTETTAETEEDNEYYISYKNYLDTFLADYETVEIRQSDFNGTENLENKPDGTYALKFTDVPGAAVVISDYVDKIIAFGMEIECEEKINLNDFTGYIDEEGEGALILTQISGMNNPRDGKQLIVTRNETYLTDMNKDRYNTTFFAAPEEGKLGYYRYNKEFFTANNQGLILWLSTYKTEDQIFEEKGTFTLSYGRLSLYPEEGITLNDWYKSDEFGFSNSEYADSKEKRDLWGYDTFIKFICRYGSEKLGWTEDDLGEYASVLNEEETVYEEEKGIVMSFDEFSAGYEIHEVREEMGNKYFRTLHERFDEEWKDRDDIPEKIVMQFSDVKDLAIIASVRVSDENGFDVSLYGEKVYAFGRCYDIDFGEENNRISDMNGGWDISHTNDAVVIGWQYYIGTYFVYHENGCREFSLPSGIGYSVKCYDGRISYLKQTSDFAWIQQYWGALYGQYTSPDQFFADYGYIKIEDGKVKVYAQQCFTVEEWYESDYYHYPEQREENNIPTFEDYVEFFDKEMEKNQ